MTAAKRYACLAVLAVLATLLGGGGASAQPSVSSKRAEAARVMSQIQSLDAELGQAVEAYNAARVKLDEIRADQRENRRHLVIARSSFGKAQATLEERLLTLYTSDDTTTAEILLGAEGLDDLLARLEAVDRVSEQDARIIREIRAFRKEIKQREAELAAASAKQESLVSELSERRAGIESQIAERNRLLSSIKSEIQRIQAAERRRQQRLAEQARERLSSSGSNDGGSGSGSGGSGGSSGESGGSSGESPASDVGGAVPPPRNGGVVGIAMQYLGIPYRWGGASPSTGFDCSGFVMYVYAQVGISLPHNAAMQYGYGTPVSRSQLAPGDLVFFNGLGHNGIYIGGNQFIHSPHTGDVVKISSITGWYSSTWVGARRL